MAVSKQNMDLTSGLTVVRDTDANETVEADVNGGAAILHAISIDNSANAAAASFFKAYDATGPTVGTTAPDIIIRVPGGATCKLVIPQGLSLGTGLSFAAVTTGGTAGTTGPTSDVSVIMAIE